MKFAAQIVVCVTLLVSLLMNLKYDVKGRRAKEPEGFAGIIGTLISLIVVVVVYAYAGAFSMLGGPS